MLARRGPKVPVDPRRPVAWFIEPERAADGAMVPVLTVLLANRECPWKCVYCDLWRHTLDAPSRPGDVAEQVRVALRESGFAEGRAEARQIKLYNAGSFFDPQAIPDADARDIAGLVRGFDQVIVESHPRLVGDRTLRFRDALGGGKARLEVAMGLESADPEVLARLNKGMTLDDFARSAARLAGEGIDLRAFVLVQPPYSPRESAGGKGGTPEPGVHPEACAADFAFAQGAGVVSLIPTREGNGVLDELRRQGVWEPPSLERLEAGFDAALALGAGRGRVFVDLWDLERFSTCTACLASRRDRLQVMNATQAILPRIACPRCASW